MTGEEAKLWDSAHKSYREDEQMLIKDSGKVYALILEQCTQTLLEALQEDADWDDISMKCDHIELCKLIEKCVLKQTSSTYPYLTLMGELRGLCPRQELRLGQQYRCDVRPRAHASA